MLDAEHLPEAIDATCQQVVQTLLAGGKVLCIGFKAQQLPAARLQQVLLHGLQFERPALPALLISATLTTANAELGCLATSSDLAIWFTASSDTLQSSLYQQLRDTGAAIICVGHAPSPESPVTQSLVIQENLPHKLLEKQLLITHALSHCIEQQLFGEPS